MDEYLGSGSRCGDLIQDVASRWQEDPKSATTARCRRVSLRGSGPGGSRLAETYADAHSLSAKGRLEPTKNDYTAKDAIALTYLGIIYSQQGRDRVGREYWNAAQSFPKDYMLSDSPLDEEAWKCAENMVKGMFAPAPGRAPSHERQARRYVAGFED